MNKLLTKPSLWLTMLSALLTTMIFSGCSTTPGMLDTNNLVQPVPHDYLIGPGDTVNVVVWRNPEVSLVIPVRPDGKITTPLVEDIVASGKTSTQLARDIEKALAKFIQQPVVTVIVTAFSGPFDEQIRVIGQALKPQSMPYREGMSLMDVMITVGGITDFASGNKANIIRTVNGKRQTLNVRLNDLIKEGDISANVPVQPGDVLVIPQSFF